MIIIDGKDGGGQMLRTAIAMSALTGNPVKIINIRGARPNPGLKAQHMTGVMAVADLCDAKVSGFNQGSREIEFIPGKIKGGQLKFDIGTAGSVTLVLQALIPAAIHAKEEVTIELIGGTEVAWSPSTIFFEHIFCYYLQKMGIDILSEVESRGFYPTGGGKIIVRVKPCKKLKKLELISQGKLEKIDIWSVASDKLKAAKVAERQINGFKTLLKKNIDKENIEYASSLSPGSLFHAHAHYANCKIGAEVIGEKSKKAEEIGAETAKLLAEEMNSNCTFDSHMADQILPYLALAGGGKIKTSKITNHIKTSIKVIETFLPVKFDIAEKEKIISCRLI